MNWGLLGHEWAVEILGAHIANERVRHAYLFVGLPGLGRRTLALRFAQALNCTQPPAPGAFCGQCRDCKGLAKMAHPDLNLILEEGTSDSLKVDQIRELQRSLFLAPYQARYRLALLPNFQRATISAANALLKTLEEPPRQVILLLTAENTETLLPTIVSRCEVLRLRPLSPAALASGMESQWQLEPDQARLLAHIADGRPGFARRLNEHPELLQERTTWLDEHHQLLSSGQVERFAYADQLSKDKERLRSVLETWLSYWRDIMLRTRGSGAELTNLDREAEINALASRLEPGQPYQTVVALRRTQHLLDHNANRRLATEVLMLDLPRL